LSTLGLPILGSPKLDLPVPGALCASIALVVLMSTWAAYAERLLSRTDTDQDGNFIVQFVDVARDGDSIVVGPPVTLGSPLPAEATVGRVLPVNGGRHIVYVAFTSDASNFDDLFVVDINAPGSSQVLNAARELGVESPILFAGVNGSSNVAFALRSLTTGTDRLFVANVEAPGTQRLVTDTLPAGATIGDMEMSPDGRVLAYRIDRSGVEPQLWLSFLSGPENARVIDLPVPSSNYSPSEFRFSANSRRFLWRSGVGADPFGNPAPLRSEPLRMVEIDSDRATVSSAVQVNQGTAIEEQVFEFEIDEDSQRAFYRAIPAGSIGPGDTFTVDLAAPGVATQINPVPVAGAGFTNQEDVLIVGGSVLYNAAQENPVLVELFSAPADGSRDSSLLSGSLPLTPTSFSSSLPGVSHMVASADELLVAVVDGDPARNLFVVDVNNPARTFTPFQFGFGETIETTSRTNLTRQDPFSFSPSSEFIATLLDPPFNDGIGNPVGSASGMLVALADVNGSGRQVFPGSPQSLAGFNWLADRTALAAAILPTSRSGQVGSTLTAFASVINGGNVTATDCSLTLDSGVPIAFDYQRTNPATNVTVGLPNTSTDIPAGAVQTYLITAQVLAEFAPTETQVRFACTNASNPQSVAGLNTLLLSGSTQPVPDVVALAATESANGILELPGNTGSAAFSVATVNVGIGGTLTATVDTFGVSLPLSLGICETNLAGACLDAATPVTDTTTFTSAAGGTPSFGVFVGGGGFIPDRAAENRIRVEFLDSSGAVRGQTSVAVRTSN